MNTLSRRITGSVCILMGLSLSIVACMEQPWVLIYAIPLIILGVVIFRNKQEDVIEQIKTIDS